MPNHTAALADDDLAAQVVLFARDGAEIIDIDEVAQRRERLAAYVEETRRAIVYRFVFPDAAIVAGLGPDAAPRDARAQLQLVVGLVGGSVAKSPQGLAARIPAVLAAKFEAMAGPLVEAYLVSLDLGAEA